MPPVKTLTVDRLAEWPLAFDIGEHFNFRFSILTEPPNEKFQYDRQIYIVCENTKSTAETPRKWEIEGEYEIIFKEGSLDFVKKLEVTFTDEKPRHLIQEFGFPGISWLYLTTSDDPKPWEGPLESHVVLTLKLADEIRKFDDTSYSNVSLKVDDKIFHTTKEFMCLQCPSMAPMFFGGFAEAGKSLIELFDIDAYYFHSFMEVIHGEPAVRDENVITLLALADRYESSVVNRNCEQFLIKLSKKILEEKCALALNYKLEELFEHCLFTTDNLQKLCELVPDEISTLTRPFQIIFYRKAKHWFIEHFALMKCKLCDRHSKGSYFDPRRQGPRERLDTLGYLIVERDFSRVVAHCLDKPKEELSSICELTQLEPVMLLTLCQKTKELLNEHCLPNLFKLDEFKHGDFGPKILERKRNGHPSYACARDDWMTIEDRLEWPKFLDLWDPDDQDSTDEDEY